MFRMNGTPRAQGCAGAVPLNLAQCLTQGGGESGDRSKGHELLFSADYADYADYCMRPAWAMRSSGASQFYTESRYLHGSGGRAVPYFRTRCYVQDERYIAKEHMDVRRDCVNFAQRLATCMGAKAAQYLASGRAVKHPCALILDSCLVRS